MSHNKITVAGQQPNSSGNVSVSIDNLSDTNFTSLSSNEVVKWDGSQWVNGTAPAPSSEYLLIGRGQSNAYSNSSHSTGTSLTSGHKLELYDTAPLNTLNATLTTNANNWISQIQLPAGRYMTMLNVNANFQNSGYVEYEIEDTSNNRLSYSAVIGDTAHTFMRGASTTITNYLNLTTSTTIRINLKTVSSNALHTSTNQGNTISEHSTLFILKVG